MGLAAASAGGFTAGGAATLFWLTASAGARSSSDIASLKLPSTITTTLAPTSSERILEVMLDAPVADARGDSIATLVRPGLSLDGDAAAAACAARRAAAMKFDELDCSRDAAEISPIALSEAAMRSDGELPRAGGRVPGSSG